MNAYHLYLLRHGMTDANQSGRYIGSTDVSLSPEGEKQLKELAGACVYPYAELFFSSPLKRCTQTLQILYPGASPCLVPDLAECSFGEYEGKTFDELKENEEYRRWIAGSGVSAPPGGESGPAFQARCCRGFASIVDSLMRSGRHTAVVMAHGGTILSVLSSFGLPRRQFYEWMTDCGCGYEVAVTPQLWANGKIIEVVASIPEGHSAGEDGPHRPAEQ